jgi:hypothetical protein
MHRLEDPVAAQRAEIVGPEDRRIGGDKTPPQHGYHAFRHAGRLPDAARGASLAGRAE